MTSLSSALIGGLTRKTIQKECETLGKAAIDNFMLKLNDIMTLN